MLGRVLTALHTAHGGNLTTAILATLDRAVVVSTSIFFPPTTPGLELAGAAPVGPWSRASDSAVLRQAEDAPSSGARTWRQRLEVFTDSIWFAVPKRKSSYSRKRKRQMSPIWGKHDLQNFYPCPKCPKGLVKLRHHICPCDQEKANFMGIKKVQYLSVRKAPAEKGKGAEGAAGAAAERPRA
jgi:ribosomal protein L32